MYVLLVLLRISPVTAPSEPVMTTRLMVPPALAPFSMFSVPYSVRNQHQAIDANSYGFARFEQGLLYVTYGNGPRLIVQCEQQIITLKHDLHGELFLNMRDKAADVDNLTRVRLRTCDLLLPWYQSTGAHRSELQICVMLTQSLSY